MYFYSKLLFDKKSSHQTRVIGKEIYLSLPEQITAC